MPPIRDRTEEKKTTKKPKTTKKAPTRARVTRGTHAERTARPGTRQGLGPRSERDEPERAGPGPGGPSRARPRAPERPRPSRPRGRLAQTVRHTFHGEPDVPTADRAGRRTPLAPLRPPGGRPTAIEEGRREPSIRLDERGPRPVPGGAPTVAYTYAAGRFRQAREVNMLRQTYAQGQEILQSVRRMNPRLNEKQFSRLAPHGRYGNYVQLLAKRSGIDAQIIEMYAPKVTGQQFRRALSGVQAATPGAQQEIVTKHVRRIQTFTAAGQIFGVDVDWLLGDPPPTISKSQQRMIRLAKQWLSDPTAAVPDAILAAEPGRTVSGAGGAAGVHGTQAAATVEMPGDKDVPLDFVLPINTAPTGSSQFNVQDPEGADGYHSAYDWMGGPGATVMSPIDGEIVEVTPSQGNSGQIFGGVVKVRGRDGKVWVFRHVDPAQVRVGQRVGAGHRIATITRWSDAPGSSHAHVELWRTLDGGYHHSNMIDPLPILQQAGRR